MRLSPVVVAASCLVLAGCGQGGGEPTQGAAPAAPTQPAELTPEERAAALAALPAPYNTADLENGRLKFGLCRSCHSLDAGGPDMTGPNLHAVFGRQAGSKEGYNYSDALEGAGFVWGPEQLDHWLANPKTFLPGNKMTFLGLKNPKDRTDLIAYLMVEAAPPPAAAAPPAP